MNTIEEEKCAFLNTLVIEPENGKKHIFDLFISMCTIADFLLSSYGFFIDNSVNIAISIITAFLFIDIILKFIQGYFKGSQQILDIKEIALNYLLYYNITLGHISYWIFLLRFHSLCFLHIFSGLDLSELFV